MASLKDVKSSNTYIVISNTDGVVYKRIITNDDRSVDSIGEFKLEVGSLSAEFGRSGGSMTNMAIKSGTNQIHGTMYEFFRNSKLDANQFFQRGQGRKLAAFGSHTYGFGVGGPVLIPKLYDGRNRTFFFSTSLRFHSVSKRSVV